MQRPLLWMLILLSPGATMAALDTEDSLFAVSRQAMDAVDKQDYAAAVEVIRPHMPLPEHEIDGLVYQIRQQIPTIQERFGKPQGSGLVCVESIGGSLKRLTYLQRYERHAVLWFFDFYRPVDQWIINTFSFHDRWQELFRANCADLPAAAVR